MQYQCNINLHCNCLTSPAGNWNAMPLREVIEEFVILAAGLPPYALLASARPILIKFRHSTSTYQWIVRGITW